MLAHLKRASSKGSHLSIAAIMCSCEGGEKVEREEEREEESELLLRVLATTLLIIFGSEDFIFVASIVSSLSYSSAF